MGQIFTMMMLFTALLYQSGVPLSYPDPYCPGLLATDPQSMVSLQILQKKKKTVIAYLTFACLCYFCSAPTISCAYSVIAYKLID